MKTLIALITLALASLAPAREVTFAWDANPEPDVTRYRVYLYDLLDDRWNIIAEVADDPATPANDTPTEVMVDDFPNVVSRVRATAVNSAGLESLPSEEVIVAPIAPGAPEGFHKVSLETSANGVDWELVADYYFPSDEPLFTRLTVSEAFSAP